MGDSLPKTFDVEVVADTVGERAVVQQVAPHIPKPDPMLLPIYEGRRTQRPSICFL